MKNFKFETNNFFFEKSSRKVKYGHPFLNHFSKESARIHRKQKGERNHLTPIIHVWSEMNKSHVKGISNTKVKVFIVT